MAKVLLVYSFEKDKLITRALRPSLPVNMVVLASELKRGGIDSDLFDLRLHDHAHLKSLVENNDYVCAGLSILTGSCISRALELAQIIRQAKPHVPLIWGGVHPTLEPESTALHPLVDIVARGEGEETFPELVLAMTQKKPLDSVAGIYFKNGGGEVVKTAARKTYDINQSTAPYYDLLKSHDFDFSTLDYESSRGCPFRCKFCDVLATHRNTWKGKNPDKVVSELKSAVHAFQPQYIHFIDDNFFANKDRATKIAEGLAPLNIQWYASCRADMFSRFDDAYVKKIRESGCFKIMMGVESASQRVLDNISKGIKVEQIEQSAQKAHAHDIQLVVTLMAGLPNETMDDMKQTVNFILALTKKYDNVIVSGIYFYSPYPATPFFHKAVEMGFKPPKSLEEWGRFELSKYENIPWHNKRYLKKIEPLALISRIGIMKVSVRKNILGAFLKGHIDRAAVNMVRLWFRLRMKFQFYTMPYDIYLFDRIRRKVFPNS